MTAQPLDDKELQEITEFAKKSAANRLFLRFNCEIAAMIAATRNGASDERLIDITRALHHYYQSSAFCLIANQIAKLYIEEGKDRIGLVLVHMARELLERESKYDTQLANLIDVLEADYNKRDLK